ncbi:MAG: YhcH/YjgK/YiaL family protein [Synergistaceae bacterium]|nr:YhcH/YjgK/YiaL family protein [Synergistaceae bacterium]
MLSCNVKISTKYDYLSEKFKAGYKWLEETNIKALDDGKYPILGDDVVASVQSYTTEPAETRRFEAHDKYFDIQYIAEGQEYFGVCHREGMKETEAHPDRDLYFFAEPEISGMILLREGDLIVVEPEEAHKPKCAAGSPSKVKKVVIKVKI